MGQKSIKQWTRQLANMHTFWVFVILVLMCLGFTLITPPHTFLTLNNFKNLAADASQLIILCVAATYLLIAAGLDLSVGSVIVLTTVVTLKFILALGGTEQGIWVLFAGALFAMVFATLMGIINGILIAVLNIPAFIATLGTMGAALGFARLISGGTNVPGVPLELMRFMNTDPLGIPMPVFIALAVALLGAVVLNRTVFGLHTFALGSNMEAARRAGLPINRQQIALYALTGLLVGIVAIIDLGRFGVASIAAHTTDSLQAIAGAVIGGTSLFGGRGSVLGSVVGALIPAVLRNGFIITGLQPFWQEVAVSFVLIAAVYFDQWRRARMASLEASLVEQPKEQRATDTPEALSTSPEG
jgi:ribose transport system permease protein